MRWDMLLLLLLGTVLARRRGVAADMGDGSGGVGGGIDVDDDWTAGLEVLLTFPAERRRRRICEMGPRLEMGAAVRRPACGVLDGI